MRRFKFQLQTKLNVVLIHEDRKKQELQARQEALNTALESLKGMKLEYFRLYGELKLIHQNRPEADLITLYKNYLSVLQNKINAQERQVQMYRQALEKCQQELLTIMVDRKVLEKLKTRKWMEFQEQALSEEQKAIDEIAINNHGRHNLI